MFGNVLTPSGICSSTNEACVVIRDCRSQPIGPYLLSLFRYPFSVISLSRNMSNLLRTQYPSDLFEFLSQSSTSTEIRLRLYHLEHLVIPLRSLTISGHTGCRRVLRPES